MPFLNTSIKYIVFSVVLLMLLFLFASIYNDETCNKYESLIPIKINLAPSQFITNSHRSLLINKMAEANADLSSIEKLINSTNIVCRKIDTPNLREEYFYELTDSIFKIADYYNNIDTLFKYFYWSKQLYYIKLTNINELEDFQESIKNSWSDYLVRKLYKINLKKLNQCQEEKYYFIVKDLQINGYQLDFGQSDFEKIIFNIMKCNWGHLFEAVFYKTSIFQKIFISLFLIIIFLLYIEFIIKLFNRVRCKKN